jgi:hypothetical protein
MLIIIHFRGSVLTRNRDPREWKANGIDWLEEGYAGSFPVRPSQFKDEVMRHHDGSLVVEADGAMVLYNSEKVEIAQGRMAVDKMYYEAGMCMWE